jgi:hypothetical protein
MELAMNNAIKVEYEKVVAKRDEIKAFLQELNGTK